MEIVPAAILFAISGIVLVLRTLYVFAQIRTSSSPKQSKPTGITTTHAKPARTVVVLGSGGHTTEMLQLLSSLSPHSNYKPLSYIIASTDTTSMNHLNARYNNNTNDDNDDNDENDHSKKEERRRRQPSQAPSSLPPHEHVYKIPRAREVGQSYLTSIFTTLHSLCSTAQIILYKTPPDLLLINGPGTCLPIALWTFVGRVLGLCKGRIVFCESFCRVTTLSLTGRILRSLGIVDLFLVHWQELVEICNGDSSSTFTSAADVVLIESFIRHN